MNRPRVQVPSEDAGIWEIFEFALTFDGYGRGGFNGAAEIANTAQGKWRRDRVLPTDLDDLRTCLFFEQRRWRHFGSPPDAAADTYIRELVGAIRTASGGFVEREDPVL